MKIKQLCGAFALVLFSCIGVKAEETTLVLEQNFDVFTEGSESEPASTDIASTPSSYNSKLKSTIDWTGYKVYEAGGALKIGDGGNIETPYLNLSTDGGIYKITMRVKSLSDYGGQMIISKSYSTVETLSFYDDEWHEIEVIATGGSNYNKLKFMPSLAADGILIDDVKVVTGKFMVSPTAYQPTTANGTSFLARWKQVTGATEYILNVYSKNGENKDFLLENENVGNVTQYTVNGLTEGVTYYYTVSASDGSVVSKPSNEIEVIEVITSVTTPVANNATNVTETGFTASWNAVDKAAFYEVTLTKIGRTKAPTLVEIMSEDFSKITSGTLTLPEYKTNYMHYPLDEYTHSPGWNGENLLLAEGYMGLSTYSEEAYLISPALDLTNDEGRLTVKIKMGAIDYTGSFIADKNVTVRLYNGNSTEAEESEVITLTDELKEYEVSFTKGTEESYVEIGWEYSEKLWIDNIAIEQLLPPNTDFESIEEVREVEGLSTDFTVEWEERTYYTYTVKAFVRTVISGYVDYLGSEPSNKVEVRLDNGVIELDTPEALQPIDATKTSFTAEWMFVDKADIYLLDVYTKDGDVKNYFLKDQEAIEGEASYYVEGLTEGETYYYQVRAKSGEFYSEYSNEIEVVEVIDFINAPQALEATDVNGNGFTASWTAVEGADGYELKVIRHTIDGKTEIVETSDMGSNLSKSLELTLDNDTYYTYTVKAYVRTVVERTIGLLYSEESNEIEASHNYNAIEGISINDNAVDGIYTIDGRKVENKNLPSGIYVIKKGKTTKKISIK